MKLNVEFPELDAVEKNLDKKIEQLKLFAEEIQDEEEAHILLNIDTFELQNVQVTPQGLFYSF